MKVNERLGEFAGHINPAGFPALRCRQTSVGVVPLDQKETAAKVEVAPLKSEEFA